MTELGEWLKRRMADRGLTYNATAVYAGVGQATISDIINKGHIPRVDTLHRLADYFGTSRTEVLRLAGYLDPETQDLTAVVPAETEREIQELCQILREIGESHPDTAERIIRSTHVMAESVRAALAAQEPEEDPEKNRTRESENSSQTIPPPHDI